MNTTIGIAEKSSQLVKNIINMNKNCKRESGEYAYQPTPCAETMKFYQLLMVNDDEDSHLLKQDQSKMKDRRRQMGSTFVRNFESHIDSVGCSNFRHISKIWDSPKGIRKGSLVLLGILKDTTGAHFQPTNPYYLLNEDVSSQYYFSGSFKRND